MLPAGTAETRVATTKCTAEILESQRYPEITFTPTKMSGKVELQGDSNAQVEGILRSHGSDHAMTLTFPVQTKGAVLAHGPTSLFRTSNGD
jgi:polyisoprenoid-binding protein YceI